jgi:prepilin-type N-terminal cleavage/methylation domain-containing protein/prepilin-type processing-associated H-X9-DG protein
MVYRSRHRGITLIELLVVITIIAVLLSVLLPALAAARVEGQRTKCLTHLRGIAQAATAYSTDDPDGVYGPVHPMAAEYPGSRGYHAAGYADYGGGPGTVNIPSVGQVYMWNQPFDPATRPLNQIIYGVDGISQPDFNNPAAGDRNQFEQFRCPGEEFGYQEWPQWANVVASEVEQPYFVADGTSFRMNNLVWSASSRNDKPNTMTAGIYGRPVNRIPDTALVLGFMEARAFQTIFTNDVWGTAKHGVLSGYHKKLGYFNLSYVDGHVASANMGNGTFFQQSIRNNFLDVRGKWGRMDCFPDKSLPDPPER